LAIHVTGAPARGLIACDGDGKLNEAERKAAREAFQNRRGN
jgi:hypothetical protein